jgi:hypothetical protein
MSVLLDIQLSEGGGYKFVKPCHIFCACPNPGPGIQMPFVMVFFVFNGRGRGVIVHFVDID